MYSAPFPERVVAFGPSLIDVCAKLSDEQYSSCCRILGVAAGEWCELESYSQVSRLVEQLTGETVEPGSELDAIAHRNELILGAGSSTLGMLTSMPTDMRPYLSYVSVVGCADGRPDPFSDLFTAGLAQLGIVHERSASDGRNPIGFVLSGASDPERTLAMYSGVARDFSGRNSSYSAEFALIDTYELVRGGMAEYLHRLISQGSSRIALSLGDQSLLAGELRQRIRAYLTEGKVEVLCGNAAEYQALFPEVTSDLTTPLGFRDHPARLQVDHSLITFDIRGISAHCMGEFVSTKAMILDNEMVMNTGGAGDAAAGAFCAGVLSCDPPAETLEQAVSAATRAVQTMHPQLLGRSTVDSVRRRS